MALQPGQFINNRYQIAGLLGQGGMGSVYRAFDRTLNRNVAIKEQVPDPNASPQGLAQTRAQFQREAQVLANLSHPNLPRVTDYFSFNGNEYLVMDLIEGQSLAEVAQKHGAVGEGAVRAWANQVLDALIYLHSQTPPIIHRDIKPANIILKTDGRVVLVDFGLVKLLDPNNPRTLSAMRAMGTPEYAPIEQFSPGMHTDARSDIYSLGATIYQLLSGNAPVDVPRRMVDANAMPALRVVKPTITQRTEEVVQRALEIKPEHRFQNANEMKQALNGLPMVGTPSQTMPAMQNPFTRAANAIRRHPGWTMAIVAALLAVCVIGIGAIALTLMPTPTPAPTSPPPTNAPGATQLPTTIPTPRISPTPLPRIPSPPSTSFNWIAPTSAPVSRAASTSTPAAVQVPSQRLGKDNAEMVFVPSGEFSMGWDNFRDDTRQHTINLDAFWIDKYEVTNGLYAKCVAEGKCQPPNSFASQTRAAYFGNAQYDNFPVINVSWNDAKAYCEWTGKRLPTEAEWEKAARGTDRRGYPWGDVFGSNKINSLESRRGDTTVVDYFLSGASPYGAQDMAGNVWEWVADWYDQAYYSNSLPNNPKGPSAGDKKVLRGGSWMDPQQNVLTFNRFSAPPLSASAFAGFRCALEGSAATVPTIAPTVTPTGTARLGNDNAEMVRVDAGEFRMGSDDSDKDASSDEKPAHTVYLDAFWMDKYEVTNALYKKCVDAGKCRPPSNTSSHTSSAYYGDPKFDNYPVIYVNWEQAKTYCDWAGKRLPTEAEWEKAARGTDGKIYPWGNSFEQSRLNSNSVVGDTSEVGKYSSGASPYGAMDMAGNVWEWVADWYGENYYASSPRNNPSGPSSGQSRILRGGAWRNQPQSVRTADRNWLGPTNSGNDLGFRCARGF